MTEWGIVGVILVLITLVSAIAKPLLTLNTSIVRLTSRMEAFGDNLQKLTADNTKSHERLWAHNDEQDKQLGDHELRISVLEHQDEK